MFGKIICIILLVVGVILFLLRLIPLVMLKDIPDSMMASAVLIAGGAIGLTMAERAK